MTLTWRQLVAYLNLNHKLDRAERANDLTITAIGSQGDAKSIERTLKELS